MQHKTENSEFFRRKLGEVVRRIREENLKCSARFFDASSGLSDGTLNRLERAKFEPKITTLQKVAEGLNMPLSEFIKEVEKELPENFTLIEEAEKG